MNVCRETEPLNVDIVRLCESRCGWVVKRCCGLVEDKVTSASQMRAGQKAGTSLRPPTRSGEHGGALVSSVLQGLQ